MYHWHNPNPSTSTYTLCILDQFPSRLSKSRAIQVQEIQGFKAETVNKRKLQDSSTNNSLKQLNSPGMQPAIKDPPLLVPSPLFPSPRFLQCKQEPSCSQQSLKSNQQVNIVRAKGSLPNHQPSTASTTPIIRFLRENKTPYCFCRQTRHGHTLLELWCTWEEIMMCNCRFVLQKKKCCLNKKQDD